MDYPLTSVFTEVTATAMQLECPVTNRHRLGFIAGSCHGILCIAINLVSVILWNPSIRKFTQLPSLENSRVYDFSFGYDHSSDTYKVVACLCNVYVGVWKPLVKVHTLGTNSWRTIQDFPSDSMCRYVGKICEWNY
jgi:F-box interacting protein